MSKIEVIDESDECTTLSEALAADSKNMKVLLKSKWQELTVDQK